MNNAILFTVFGFGVVLCSIRLFNKMTLILLVGLVLFVSHARSEETINSTQLIQAGLSTDCQAWEVEGVCLWLKCTLLGCSVKTSIKYKHYIPDVVVSSYHEGGANPWSDVSGYSNTIESSSLSETNSSKHQTRGLVFRHVDIVASPAILIYEALAETETFCESTLTPFMPHFISRFDSLGWRWGATELFYPASWAPGMREVEIMTNNWGNIFPRHGFINQVDDFKASAVIAHRAADIVTRELQPHVYLTIQGDDKDGYWPPGGLVESDANTGKWQLLTPETEQSCEVFPYDIPMEHRSQNDSFSWHLWRPYSCCEKKGQIFLGSLP